MKEITMIGLDLAKSWFQVHATDAEGNKIHNRKLHRNQMALYFSQIPPCVVVMEACASSGYWAKRIIQFGHQAKRIHPRYVAQFRFRSKTDALDAAAICLAARQPDMPEVHTKTQEQCDLQAIHRVRQKHVQHRTATANQIRGLLAEDGIIIPQGITHVRKQLPSILDDAENGLSQLKRELLQEEYMNLLHIDTRINALTRKLTIIAKEREDCRRLLQIPGVGPMVATALVSVAGNGKCFKSARAFSAYLGLVPREHSSGGKQRLLGITKQGNSYIRSLLVQGAHAVIIASQRHSGKKIWLKNLIERRGLQKAAVAEANKIARIAWSMLAKETSYQAPAV